MTGKHTDFPTKYYESGVSHMLFADMISSTTGNEQFLHEFIQDLFLNYSQGVRFTVLW